MTLRVQVPSNHILTPNLYYNSQYPKPKYLTMGYLDPEGDMGFKVWGMGFKAKGWEFGGGGSTF